MALDITDPKQITYQVLWGTPMFDLWLVYEELIVKLPKVDQIYIKEELEHIFKHGHTNTVVASIKYHTSNPEKWDTARHLIDEHKSIKASMAKNREKLRVWMKKVSDLLSANFTPHPSINAAKKNKEKRKA